MVAELGLRLPARYKQCLIGAGQLIKRLGMIRVDGLIKIQYTRMMTGRKVLVVTKSTLSDKGVNAIANPV